MRRGAWQACQLPEMQTGNLDSQPCVRYCKCLPKPVPRYEFNRRARYIHQYITIAIAKIFNMVLIFAVARDLERNGDFPQVAAQSEQNIGGPARTRTWDLTVMSGQL
jgi:hypothetical protein